MKRKLTAILFFLLLPISLSPFSPAAATDRGISGRWYTYDDHSGERRSIVVLEKLDHRLVGRIEKVFFKPGDEKKCSKCTGEKKDQDVEGLEIISGLTEKDGIWQGGTILDPENGKEYTCRIRQNGDELEVKGYLFIFYRTQTWKRCPENEDLSPPR